jgi:hypothetical protein
MDFWIGADPCFGFGDFLVVAIPKIIPKIRRARKFT